MLFYSDPFKDNPYGKLQGEIGTVWATLTFDELKVYEHDGNYILAGIWTNFVNVVRSYKPEQAIDYPVTAIWTIHDKDYEVRKKNDAGKYETQTWKASVHEKLLHQHIKANPDTWLNPSKNLKGEITHLNDASYEMGQAGVLPGLPINSFKVELIEPTGKLPEWTPPKGYSKGSYGNGKASLDDKVTWLKEELTEALLSDSQKEKFKANPPSVHMLAWEITQQHKDNEMFIAAYMDLLKGILA